MEPAEESHALPLMQIQKIDDFPFPKDLLSESNKFCSTIAFDYLSPLTAIKIQRWNLSCNKRNPDCEIRQLLAATCNQYVPCTWGQGQHTSIHSALNSHTDAVRKGLTQNQCHLSLEDIVAHMKSPLLQGPSEIIYTSARKQNLPGGSRANEQDKAQWQMFFRRTVPLVTSLGKAKKGEKGQGTAGAEPDQGCKEQQEPLQVSQPEKEDQRKNSSLRSKTGKLEAMDEKKSAQLCLCRQQHRSFRVSHTYPIMVRIPQTAQLVPSRNSQRKSSQLFTREMPFSYGVHRLQIMSAHF